MENDIIDVCEAAKEKQEKYLRQPSGRLERLASWCQKYLPEGIVCDLSLRE